MSSRNVLITAASRRVTLVQAFRRALAGRGGGRVIVTDVNPLSPAVHVADRACLVSMADAPTYIDEILAIARAERVGLVVPTIDDELSTFGYAVSRFAAEGIAVAVSPSSTTEICHDKYETCRALTAAGVAAAASFLPSGMPQALSFPLFIKPRYGRGGVGAYAIRNRRDLEFFLDYVPEPVVQEYLDGREFTIDVLCDFSGRPLSIVPRERVVVRAGVIDRGRTVKDPTLTALAIACTRALPFAGAINIQCRIVNGRPVVFEINPRFSGGIGLTIEAGADFPRMLLDLVDGRRIKPALGKFRDNLWMTNYETSVFLDERQAMLDKLRPEVVGEVA